MVGYISVRKSENVITASIGEDAQRLARELMNDIDEKIYIRSEEMQAYAQDVSLAKAASVSNAAFANLTDVQAYITGIDRDWIDEKNTPVIQEILSSDLSMKLKKHLEFYEQRYGYRVFAEAYVTNKYGVVIGSTGRTSDYLQADEDWYQQSVSNRELWVGDLEFDDSSNSYSIDLVANLYDDDGNFTGVFKGVLDVAEIENSFKGLQATSHHESMAPYLIDKDNLVIFSGLDPIQKGLGRDVKLSEFGEDASSRDAVKKLREEYERDSGYLLSTEMRSDEQTKLLSSFSRSNGFRDFKGLGWGVIIEYETSDVLSPVHSLKRIIILISVGLTLLAIILGLYIARSISEVDPVFRTGS